MIYTLWFYYPILWLVCYRMQYRWVSIAYLISAGVLNNTEKNNRPNGIFSTNLDLLQLDFPMMWLPEKSVQAVQACGNAQRDLLTRIEADKERPYEDELFSSIHIS